MASSKEVSKSEDGITSRIQNLGLSDLEKANAAGGDDGEEEEASSLAHAEMGRRWVRKTLETSNKRESQLAARLWERNLTAVLEVSKAMVPTKSTEM